MHYQMQQGKVNMNAINKLLQEKIIILDGAMGTMLQQSGLKVGAKPEMLNIENPDLIVDIHSRYLRAGADIIYTNTFGANKFKMSKYPYKQAILAGVECASRAVKEVGYGYIAYDMGSVGELVEPLGKVTFDEVYEAFAEQVELVRDKVDMFVIETMSDLYELKAGVLAVKENSDKPIMVTMSFDEKGRTFAGCPVEAMVATMQGLGVDALGLNCSLGPKQLKDVVVRLIEMSNVPIIVKPNAGLPTIRKGNTEFDLSPQEFVESMQEYVRMGVQIVGGCCGTNDQYIALLADKLRYTEPKKPTTKHRVCVASSTKYVELDHPKIVGERINPTGKKLMKQAILDRDFSYIVSQAVEQAEAGADILDINMGMPNIDEAEMMKKAVKAVQSVVDLPVQIDSSDVKALESGLRYASGKPIVNSVNGDDDVMDKVFPLAKKYGALVVGLTLDKNGVPKTVRERVEIAQKIVKKASQYGINNKDIIIDTLTLTAGAEQSQAVNTLQSLSIVKQMLGVKTALGVSNISFGLPERSVVNRTFLTMALASGLDLAIINPNLQPMKESFLAYNLLANIDKNGEKYIREMAQVQSENSQGNMPKTLGECIMQSLKVQAQNITKEMLKTMGGLEIVDRYVIPTLNEIGDRYDKGILFLPQLISSAEVAKAVCDIVKESMPSNGGVKKVTIALASVEGDVHDIGKNIVKTVLENYGYDIIDLGRDVSVESVVDAIKKYNPQVLGLSALMTTTVKNMERTIKAVKAIDKNCFICVGGAVLTQEVAKEIGADAYSKDPRELVKILEDKGF